MNMPALLAAANIARAGERTGLSMRRLSSGFRINSSMDDPAGMSISNRMGMQIGGTQQASTNSSNGISIVQTAEGGLQEIHNILQRIRELTVQAQNDTYIEENREVIHMEIRQLSQAVTEMANGTQFNGINLLAQHTFGVIPSYPPIATAPATHIANNDPDRTHIFLGAGNGSYIFDPVEEEFVNVGIGNGTHIRNDGRQFILPDPDYAYDAFGITDGDPTHRLVEPTLIVQIGANADEHMRMRLVDARSHMLGLTNANGVIIFSIADAAADRDNLFNQQSDEGHGFRSNLLLAVDEAIVQISNMRASFGAYQNRLEHTVTGLNIMDENLQTARMRIRDTDMGLEVTHMSSSRVIEQAGMAILAQANARPQQVLQLLQ